jgi:hypothetical protein
MDLNHMPGFEFLAIILIVQNLLANKLYNYILLVLQDTNSEYTLHSINNSEILTILIKRMAYR